MITKEDIQEYYLGNPCFAGIGVRIWTPDSVENMERFQDEICDTPTGKRFCAMQTPESIEAAFEKVLEIHRRRSNIYGEEITTRSFERCLADCLNSEAITAPPKPQPKPKELTPAQKNWQACEEFVYGNKEKGIEPASRIQIEERKKVDSVFAAYLRKTTEKQWNDTLSSGGAVASANDEPSAKPTAELIRFAEAYRSEPSENLRPKGGVVLLAGERVPYQEFLNKVNKATEAGLLG